MDSRSAVHRMFRTFERIVLEELLEPLGCEMIFPKLVPWEVWQKSGHAKRCLSGNLLCLSSKTKRP
ncbi:MAG: hypothetical protein R2741_12225 [Methanolobus sp.]